MNIEIWIIWGKGKFMDSGINNLLDLNNGGEMVMEVGLIILLIVTNCISLIWWMYYRFTEYDKTPKTNKTTSDKLENSNKSKIDKLELSKKK